MEFIIDPIFNNPNVECENQTCPQNKKQCGCNTVAGCACPPNQG